MNGPAPPPLAPSLFGKLPASGDFVRRNAAGADVDELDAWLQEGLLHGQTWVPGWNARFGDAPPFAFVFHARVPGRYAVGAMAPSRDRSGRRFPFLVFARADDGPGGAGGEGIPWPLALVRYGPFLAAAADLACDAAGGLPLDGIAERAVALPAPLPVASADELYRGFLHAETGPPEDDRGRWAFTPEGARRVQAAAGSDVGPPSGLVFALGEGDGVGGPGHDVMGAFWIDWFLQTLRAPALRPFVLRPRPASGKATFLHLFPRRPSPLALALMLAGEPPSQAFDPPAPPRPGSPVAGTLGDLLRLMPARSSV